MQPPTLVDAGRVTLAHEAFGSPDDPPLVLVLPDPPVQVDGSHEIAAAVPGSRLVTRPGMGHDLPHEQWPTLIGEVTEHARRAAEEEV